MIHRIARRQSASGRLRRLPLRLGVYGCPSFPPEHVSPMRGVLSAEAGTHVLGDMGNDALSCYTVTGGGAVTRENDVATWIYVVHLTRPAAMTS